MSSGPIATIHTPGLYQQAIQEATERNVMSTFFITKVHLERAPGASHDHIARVMLLNQSRDYARSEIIYAITQGDVFYTYANPPAKVYVHSCRTASQATTSRHIPTTPQRTTCSTCRSTRRRPR